jgi:transposase InsO family protein
LESKDPYTLPGRWLTLKELSFSVCVTQLGVPILRGFLRRVGKQTGRPWVLPLMPRVPETVLFLPWVAQRFTAAMSGLFTASALAADGNRRRPPRRSGQRSKSTPALYWPRQRGPPASKEEEVWLNEYQNFDQAQLSVARWIEEYNHDRPHRGLHGRTPRDARARFAQTLTSNMAPCV